MVRVLHPIRWIVVGIAGAVAVLLGSWGLRDIGKSRGALGGRGMHVTEPRQLRPALEKAMGSGEVSCVNVVLDPAAYRRGGQVSMAI